MRNEVVFSYIFWTEDEAWEVIGRMNDIAEANDICTLADFHHIMGDGATTRDYGVGWSNPAEATVMETTNGYRIVISDPV